MKHECTFCIPGPPQGKERPRFNRKTGRVYTPQATLDYEQLVRLCFQKAAKKVDWEMNTEAPCGAVITAYYPIPKSYRNREALRGKLCTKKPDADNILKAVLDALNGIAYHDDAQVVSPHIRKLYELEGKGPCVEVDLWTMEDELTHTEKRNRK